MSDLVSIAQILEQSLTASTSKEAELRLKSMDSTQGFPLSLLHVVASNEIAKHIRLAGALYFKNLIRRRWIDESGQYLINGQDVSLIKSEIVGLMVQLPDQLQVQVGEAISLIAESEFPELWPELLDELVNRLTIENLTVNKGVLKVAHSIFKRWKPLFRSDELFLEIKMVLDKFATPFLELLKGMDSIIEHNLNNKEQLTLALQNMLLLVKIYYDLNCQDIPEFFEDHIAEGMGVMLKYLKFHSALIEDVEEDEEIDIITQVKINILQLVQLYTTRYQEEFTDYIPAFIETTWNLLNEITTQQKYDILAAKSLQFMTAIVNIPKFAATLNNTEALKSITEQIILPNVTLRETDEEMFEDDPIEFTRRDLEGSDIDSRRRSSTDFLRALRESNETEVTTQTMNYINHYLSEYQSQGNWKSKDMAIFLFSAIASKGSVTNAGVSGVNLLVDVVQFFGENIYPDLVNDVPHPILKVDAIKYIFTFRNQLTKDQLIQTFPLLSSHFQSDNYVVYTYTAITIEKILSSRNPANHQELLFNKNDIPSNVSTDLLMNLFRLMFKKGDTPEKLAENEFLMKCIMRVLLNAEDSLQLSIIEILQQLLKIVQLIAKNPSNPRFSHFTFESICVILKFHKSNMVELFEYIKPIAFELLGQEIQEFIPYIFQILSFILENYPKTSTMPIEYEQLIAPICSEQIWEFRGNIPGVERLLNAIVKFKPDLFGNNELLNLVLGVYEKLIPSKVNDNLAFDLLESIMMNIPLNILEPYLKQVAMTMLTRLQSRRTEKYTKLFILFLAKISCLENINGLNSTFVVQFIDNVQGGIFAQILNNFITPFIAKFNNLTEKKILVVGLINLLIDNIQLFAQERSVSLLSELVKMLNSDSIKNYKPMNETVEMLLEIEASDLSFGSSFNRLNIISARPFDPIKDIDSKDRIVDYFKMKLTSLSGYQQLLYGMDDEAKAAASILGL